MTNRTLQLYLEGNRVELFKDEQILINSTIQTIADISKTFTDYTQSFTIPASDQNNELFHHFYNNDVWLSGGILLDSNLKRDARIEIDGTVFREGKLSLEKANIKNGMPYSYQVTFYGKLSTLKDTFGDLKLTDLDWSSLEHDYEYQDVIDRIEDGTTVYDVRYPLISSFRYWQYNNLATPTENIDTIGGAVDFRELFPAVKLNKIFDVIASYYGITFTGNFLTDDRFTKCYQYFKNKTGYAYVTPSDPIELYDLYEMSPYNLLATSPTVYNYPITGSTNSANVVFDLGANTITTNYVEYLDPSSPFIITTDFGYHTLTVDFFNTSPNNVTYFVDTYRNGVLIGTAEKTGGGDGALGVLLEDNVGNLGISDTYNLVFRSALPMTTEFTITYKFETFLPSGYFTGIADNVVYSGQLPLATLTTFAVQNLTNSAPDVTVNEWFSNILKVFNLTCYGTDVDTFEIEPLDDWYAKGVIYDITEWTEVKSIDIQRVPLWKKILFNYKKSKSITNRFFLSQFLREYGNLDATFDYDGGEYKVEVIFENLLHSKFTDQELQVGYCIDENTNAYVPNPVLLYEYDEKPCDFYMTDGTAISTNITTYVPFGQDVRILGTDRSLNWGAENSPLLETINWNGLYDDYYREYIENLYNARNRQVTVKARLPLSILTQLDLNDRVIIRDKRYLIDTMKTNLTTGEVTLVLLNDFRELIIDGGPLGPTKRISPDAQTIEEYIVLPKNVESADITECGTTTTGLTITPGKIYESQYVSISVPALTNYYEYIVDEDGDTYIMLQENDLLIQDDGEQRTINFCVDYDLRDGSSSTSEFTYIQTSERVEG